MDLKMLRHYWKLRLRDSYHYRFVCYKGSWIVNFRVFSNISINACMLCCWQTTCQTHKCERPLGNNWLKKVTNHVWWGQMTRQWVSGWTCIWGCGWQGGGWQGDGWWIDLCVGGKMVDDAWICLCSQNLLLSPITQHGSLWRCTAFSVFCVLHDPISPVIFHNCTRSAELIGQGPWPI